MSIKERMQEVLQVNPFKRAWKRMESSGGTVIDCVEVFKYARIGNFYGEKKFKPVRQRWAARFNELIDQNKDVASMHELIIATLSPEKQASMCNDLFELIPREDSSWVSNLFRDITVFYHAGGFTNEIEAFERGVRHASFIPQEDITKCFPHIAEARSKAYSL